MTFRSMAVSLAVLLLPGVAVCSAPAASDGGTTATFALAARTQIPGKVLKPGTYTIEVVDRLSDRVILRVEKDGKAETTFLGLPDSGMPKTGASGPVSLTAKGGEALRGFTFPGGLTAEFVYPKAEAVALAKKNNTRIPAIDPASEGRPEQLDKLSSADMQEVTLWMLSPTTVGPQQGIEAARYQPSQPAQSPVTEQASSRSPQPRNAAALKTTIAPVRQTSANEVASSNVPPRPRAARRPAMSALPHTASRLPLLALVGLLSLIGAGLLSMRRQLSGAARA